ncbi:hypothetical protein BDY19DRAFT_938216, partial [Irpex rosettiformis]
MISSYGYITFECATVLLTWAKTFPSLCLVPRANIARSLFYTVFRDGTWHFFLILVVSITNVVFVHWRPFYFPLLIPLTLSDTITAVLLSRFILNLREEYAQNTDRDHEYRSLHISDMSNIRFYDSNELQTSVAECSELAETGCRSCRNPR